MNNKEKQILQRYAVWRRYTGDRTDNQIESSGQDNTTGLSCASCSAPGCSGCGSCAGCGSCTGA